MRIIYMLSGLDKEKGFYLNQIEYLKEDIMNNSNITFIASSFKNYEKTDIHFNKLLNFFKNICINFKNTYLIDYRINKKVAKENINNSDVIFIMGGDTHKEFKYIKEYNLIEVINKFNGTIIGVSAGSLNMSKNVCFLDEYQDYKIVKYKGIGLTNINIYPHFDIENEEFLNETLEVSKYTKLYALPNESFVRIMDDTTELVGDYYICENSKVVKGEQWK